MLILKISICKLKSKDVYTYSCISVCLSVCDDFVLSNQSRQTHKFPSYWIWSTNKFLKEKKNHLYAYFRLSKGKSYSADLSQLRFCYLQFDEEAISDGADLLWSLWTLFKKTIVHQK